MNTNFAQSAPVSDPKPSAPVTRRWYHRVLFGDWGLRAGWGLLLYLLLANLGQTIVEGIPKWYGQHHPAFASTLQQVEKASHDLRDRQPGGVLYSHGRPITVVLLLLWIMSRVERRPYAAYGWGIRHRVRILASDSCAALSSCPCLSEFYGPLT